MMRCNTELESGVDLQTQAQKRAALYYIVLSNKLSLLPLNSTVEPRYTHLHCNCN